MTTFKTKEIRMHKMKSRHGEPKKKTFAQKTNMNYFSTLYG